MAKSKTKHSRVAIVSGLRTPFSKAGSAYADLSALDLGKIVVMELVKRYGIADDIDQIVYGQVLPSVQMPNVAREIVLSTGLPQTIDAFSVSRACATSYQSTVNVAEAIMSGSIDCGIAGGTDSTSDIPMTLSKPLAKALLRASKARSLSQRLGAFSKIKPRHLIPQPPALKEATTGLSMGQSAEKMAKENSIKREDQDAFAHRSHQLASRAWHAGHFTEEVMPVLLPPHFEDVVDTDNIVRRDSKLEAYQKLKPVFDRTHGSITAANASPLSDGASALLMMREDKADSLGLEILGFVRSYAFSAIDPRGQLLMGPAYATPTALDRAGIELADLDLIDMHEAFAAQVLSNTQAFESKTFAKKMLGRSKAIGKIDWDKFNVNGGSIAIGHPFAATGGRQITQTLHELKRRGGGLALCTACAAGGLGAAIVVESAA